MREVLQANLAFALRPGACAGLAPAYLAMIERAGAAQLIAQNRAVMARVDMRPLLPQIACPTLVLVGRVRPADAARAAQEMAALIPGMRGWRCCRNVGTCSPGSSRSA